MLHYHTANINSKDVNYAREIILSSWPNQRVILETHFPPKIIINHGTLLLESFTFFIWKVQPRCRRKIFSTSKNHNSYFYLNWRSGESDFLLFFTSFRRNYRAIKVQIKSDTWMSFFEFRLTVNNYCSSLISSNWTSKGKILKEHFRWWNEFESGINHMFSNENKIFMAVNSILSNPHVEFSADFFLQ